MITVAKATSVEYYTATAGVMNGMESYYTDATTDGEPPGQWIGQGSAALGLAGEVVAEDMQTMYGQFVHPHTGERFGSRPAVRTSREERIAALLAAESDLTPEREAEIRGSGGGSDRANVIGWDLTFAAPKSVTVIHTAARRAEIAAQKSGDVESEAQFRHIREQIDAALREANAAGIAEAERVATARAGGGSGGATRWVKTTGLVVASFPQTINRSIDPHLHNHNVVLNRTMCADGKVRALDGRDLVAARFAYSAVSARTLTESLHTRLGLAFRAHANGAGWEVALVPQDIIDHFSTRTVQTSKALEPLVQAEEERRGRALTNAEHAALHRAAQRSSRAAKTHDGETLAELHSRWDAEVIATTGRSLNGVANRLRHHMNDWRTRVAARGADTTADSDGAGIGAGASGERLPAARWSPEQVIAQAVAATAERTATWGRADLMWELHVALPPTGINPADVPDLLHRLAGQALNSDLVVQVTGRDAGEYAAPTATRYAAANTLQAEEALRAAAVIRGRHALNRADVAAWLDTNVPDIGADQRAAVEGITASDAALAVLEGPAGTGKSYAVGALAGAWTDLTQGDGRVFGLAVSRAATKVLRDDGLALARNVKAWLDTQSRLDTRGPDATGPEGEDAPWQLRATDVVLVDEASMVGTAALEAVRARVEAAGARLVLTGDPRQLTSVEAGGVLGLLEGHAETYALTEVRRFREGWERSASLALRDGDRAALDEYDRHARLVGHDTIDDATLAAATALVADRVDGRSSVVVASTNAVAARIACQARDQLIDLDLVADGPGAVLGRDGNTATAGDVVMCRRNDRTLGVTNRVQYQVIAATPAADAGSQITGPAGWSLTVRPLTGPGAEEGREIVLPPSYVAADAQLAYASTVHAAQGLTVDTAHLVAGPGCLDMAALYVAMTRGRLRNTAHVALTGQTRAAEETAPAATTTRGGRVSFADDSERPSARAALDAVLDAGAEARTGVRTDESVAALVAAERDAAHNASMATVTARLEFETRRACRERLERHLDDLVADGVLEPEARAALAADQGSDHLSRLLRAAEQSGDNPRETLTAAVAGRKSLLDADSAAQVLAHRILKAHPDYATADNTGAAIPADISPASTAALLDLYGRAAARANELGAQAAEEAPEWAVQALGPVPAAEDADDRADWEHRAGLVAAHREAVGDTHPEQALGVMPGLSNTARRATYAAAWDALGRPEHALTETARSDGQLIARITAYRREKLWEPPNVDHQLRDHETSLEAARQAAALAEARAELATASGDRDQAEQLHADAEQLRADVEVEAAYVERLTEAAEIRGRWVSANLINRHNHDLALDEAKRRGLNLTNPADAITATDWLAHQRAAQQAEDEWRPVTEHDISADIPAADRAYADTSPRNTDPASAASRLDVDETDPAPTITVDAAEVHPITGTYQADKEALGPIVIGGIPVTPSDNNASHHADRRTPSLIELDVLTAATSAAVARLAEQRSQEAAHERARGEQLAAEAHEAGRRRRDAAEFDWPPTREHAWDNTRDDHREDADDA